MVTPYYAETMMAVKNNASIEKPEVGMQVSVKSVPNRALPNVAMHYTFGRCADCLGTITKVLIGYDNAAVLVRHFGFEAVYWLDELTEVRTEE